MLYTTKTLLHEHHACAERYKHFFSNWYKVGDDERIPLVEVLTINGFEDALWCLQATTEPCDAFTFTRPLAATFAEHVLPVLEARVHNDKRPRHAIELARRFVRGGVTKEELQAARDGVCETAWNTVVTPPLPVYRTYADNAAVFSAAGAAFATLEDNSYIAVVDAARNAASAAHYAAVAASYVAADADVAAADAAYDVGSNDQPHRDVVAADARAAHIDAMADCAVAEARERAWQVASFKMMLLS